MTEKIYKMQSQQDRRMLYYRFKGGNFKGKAAGVGALLFRDIPTLC